MIAIAVLLKFCALDSSRDSAAVVRAQPPRGTTESPLGIAFGSATMLQLCIAVRTCSVESSLSTKTCQGPGGSAKGWPSTTWSALLQCDASILVQSRLVMG